VSLRSALKSLHFDLAGAPVEEQLEALLSVANPSKLHFGSDFPFTPRQGCKMLVQQLEASRHLDDATRDAIFLDNAYDLLRVSDTGDR
jgi:predicted TIM-barrel fold metal-dependent hydrolase